MNVEEHFLAAQTLVTEEVTYSQDGDGNIMILQDGMYITLTPQQQIALKSLLEAHIDTLQFVEGKLDRDYILEAVGDKLGLGDVG